MLDPTISFLNEKGKEKHFLDLHVLLTLFPGVLEKHKERISSPSSEEFSFHFFQLLGFLGFCLIIEK